ncbi:AraC family ligand binding domain-containing protein [Sphingobacteriaceae bacterium WQ 2009]|uniref:AraC family ligand binding domain-containing protein n=1 Tax=Rhinopithecimicrobium faecis TaxID=2820698 RepID=A0A8T4HDY1_9SPHI|nr:AraC family ligand binding domain-containing protein [Sphingobacteriaceae bacterium WQ 2009]
MKRYQQFQPLLIDDYTTERWPHPLHKHAFYELIYIHEGVGIQQLNGHEIPYAKQQLFLLGPEDAHQFFVQETTHFTYIKFHQSLFIEKEQLILPENFDIKLLLNSFHKEQHNHILLKEDDQPIVQELFTLLAKLKGKETAYINFIVYQLCALLEIIKSRTAAHSAYQEDKLSKLINHINLNIRDPQQLKLQQLADLIYSGVGYTSLYFKTEMGISIQAYIQSLRKSLILQRLEIGARKKELVIEFGLTDISHLNKMLRR